MTNAEKQFKANKKNALKGGTFPGTFYAHHVGKTTKVTVAPNLEIFLMSSRKYPENIINTAIEKVTKAKICNRLDVAIE